jgi:DNA polymerase III epsilon subunit-like protein
MIILDIETSGLSPQDNGLFSIGAVDFLHPEVTFYGESRLNPTDRINPVALEINGFTEADAVDSSKQSQKELLESFAAWLDERPVRVIGGLHIAAFDIPFLTAKAEQYKVPLKLHKRTVDLHSLAYAKMLSLGLVVPLTDGWLVMDTDHIYPFVGLPKEVKPYHALNGALLEAEAVSRIIYGKGWSKKFSKFPIPASLCGPVALK